MTSVFLTLALAVQAGSISGTLRTEAGKPLGGVRVAALEDTTGAGAENVALLMGVATTNAEGIYRLTNLPAGRYLVVAGSFADPTFYPGTTDILRARAIVLSSETVPGVDFTLTGWALCQMQSMSGIQMKVVGRVTAPVGAGPAAAAGAVVGIRQVGSREPNDAATVDIDGTFDLRLSPGEYSLSLDLLPLGYSVKSISGTVDVTTSTLRVGRCSESPAVAVVEFVLQSSTPRFRVSGRIGEPTGGPMTTGDAEIRDGSGIVARSLVKEGHFEFRGIAAGRYTIRLAGNGAEILRDNVFVADQDVVLDLLPSR